MRNGEKDYGRSTIFFYGILIKFNLRTTLHSRVKKHIRFNRYLQPSIISRRLFEDQRFQHEQAILQTKLHSRRTHSGKSCVVFAVIYRSGFFFLRRPRYENLTQYFKEERARELVINRYLAGAGRISRHNSTIYARRVFGVQKSIINKILSLRLMFKCRRKFTRFEFSIFCQFHPCFKLHTKLFEEYHHILQSFTLRVLLASRSLINCFTYSFPRK